MLSIIIKYGAGLSVYTCVFLSIRSYLRQFCLYEAEMLLRHANWTVMIGLISLNCTWGRSADIASPTFQKAALSGYVGMISYIGCAERTFGLGSVFGV